MVSFKTFIVYQYYPLKLVFSSIFLSISHSTEFPSQHLPPQGPHTHTHHASVPPGLEDFPQIHFLHRGVLGALWELEGQVGCACSLSQSVCLSIALGQPQHGKIHVCMVRGSWSTALPDQGFAQEAENSLCTWKWPWNDRKLRQKIDRKFPVHKEVPWNAMVRQKIPSAQGNALDCHQLQQKCLDPQPAPFPWICEAQP